MKKPLLVFCAAVVYFMLIALANAQNAPKSQFGMLYGFSVPDSDNTNPRQIYGVKGAAYLSPTMSLGGYYLISNKDEGSGGRVFDYTLHGLELATHIPSNTGDTSIGLRVGLSKVNTEPTTSETVIFSPYHFGLAAGYDHFLLPWVSVGFEGHYLSVQKSSTTKNTVRYEEPSFSIIGFLVALQIRL